MSLIKTSIFFTFILLPTIVRAQLTYEVYANYGISNFMQNDNDDYVDQMVNYKWSTSYSLGSCISISFFNTRLSLVSGMDYSQLSSYNNDYYIDENLGEFVATEVWQEKIHLLRIPLQIGYKADNVIRLKLGISNNLNFKASDNMWAIKVSTYNLGGLYNIDFFLSKRIVLGFELYHDITPFAKAYDFIHLTEGIFNSFNEMRNFANTLDIEYRAVRGSLRLSYLF